MQKVLKKVNTTISIWHILVAAFLLRLLLINQSFWLDEGSQAMTSFRSVRDILFNNTQDFHPPLMYLLTHFWIIISHSEIWLRLLPVGFGIGTIYVGYLLAKKMFNENVSLLFSMLFSIAPYHIYYSQEFRMYSLVTFLVIVSMYFFVQLIEGRKKTFTHFSYVISSVLILYTHYLGGTILFAQLLFLLFYKRKMVKLFAGYFALIGLLFFPWLPQLFAQLQAGVAADSYLPGWTQMLSLSFYKAIPLLFVKFILGRIDFENILLYVSLIAVGFSFVSVSLLPLLKKIREEKIAILVFWFFIPVMFTFLISFKLPMFQPLRLLFCLPAFYLLIALGISYLKKHQSLVFSVLLLFLLFCQSLFWFNPNFWREDWRTAVRESNQFVGEEGEVVFAWSEVFPPYQFYAPTKNGYGAILKNPANFEEVDQQLLSASLGRKVVYFSYLSQLTDPQDVVKQWFELRGYKLIETKDYSGVGFVHYYVSSDQVIGLISP